HAHGGGWVRSGAGMLTHRAESVGRTTDQGSRLAITAGRFAAPVYLFADPGASEAAEQFKEGFGRVQTRLSEVGPAEETGQDTLADGRRIQNAPHPRVVQLDADGAADGRLVATQQLVSRVLLPGLDATDQGGELVVFCHQTRSSAFGLRVLAP